MFKNMKLATKVLSGFIAIALIACVIGVVGITNIKKIDHADTMMYEKIVIPLGQLSDISTSFQRIRVNVRDFAYAKTKEDRAKFETRIKELRKETSEVSAKYEKTIITDEGRRLFDEFVKTRENYGAQLEKIISLVNQDKIDEAVSVMNGEGAKTSREEQNAIDKLQASKTEQGTKTSENNTSMANTATYTMSAFIIVGFIIALVLGIFISQNIKGILTTLLAAIKNLVDAAVGGKLATRADAEKINFEFRGIAVGLNETLDAVIGPLNVAAEYVDRICKGDIPPKITDTYNGDFNEIKNNLNQCIDAVQRAWWPRRDMLVECRGGRQAGHPRRCDQAPGRLPARWSAVSTTPCDAVIGPLNVAAEYVDRISKGDIPPKITDTYNGDFNEIKNNLNQCIDAMNGLLAETDKLVEAHGGRAAGDPRRCSQVRGRLGQAGRAASTT